MQKNEDKLKEDERNKYLKVNNQIDEILIEFKKPTPNKEKIIEIFSNLHTSGDLPSEIMKETDDILFGSLKYNMKK